MTYARSNKLIGQNASKLEYHVLGYEHQTTTCPIKYGRQTWAEDETNLRMSTLHPDVCGIYILYGHSHQPGFTAFCTFISEFLTDEGT